MTRTEDRDEDRRPRTKRLVLSVVGRGGAGKTDLWTTAKEPIRAFSTDPNTEDVVQKIYKVSDSRDIPPRTLDLTHLRYPLGFEPNEDDVRDDADREMQKVFDYIYDLTRGKLDLVPATVVFDTGTELDTMNILAKFGRTDKISPAVRRIKMGEVNNNFKGIFRGLDQVGCHVIIAHRAREVWETVIKRTRGGGQEEIDQRVPDTYERIGFRQMENIINAEVLVMFDPNRRGKLSDKFGIRFLKSNMRPGLVGQEFWGKDDIDGELVRCASFAFIGKCIYPDSRLSEWE